MRISRAYGLVAIVAGLLQGHRAVRVDASQAGPMVAVHARILDVSANSRRSRRPRPVSLASSVELSKIEDLAEDPIMTFEFVPLH